MLSLESRIYAHMSHIFNFFITSFWEIIVAHLTCSFHKYNNLYYLIFFFIIKKKNVTFS